MKIAEIELKTAVIALKNRENIALRIRKTALKIALKMRENRPENTAQKKPIILYSKISIKFT